MNKDDELETLRSQLAELRIENAGLRWERDELLRQREGTLAWMGDLMRTSPIATSEMRRQMPTNSAELDILGDDLVMQFPEQKIRAIKELRSRSQLGLKEAKDVMDAAYARRDRARRVNYVLDASAVPPPVTSFMDSDEPF